MKFKSLVWVIVGGLLVAPVRAETWVTVFVKRGFVGDYEAKWAGGTDVSLRIPVPVMAGGERVRVWLESSRTAPVSLGRLSLVKGANREGAISPPSHPVTFQGQASLEIPPKSEAVCSDEVAMPITPGLWYLQQSYGSPRYLYAYDSNGCWSVPGAGAHDEPAPGTHRTAYPGNVTRIDLLTREAPPVLVCYGDSITQGYASTPNTGHRYPELLGTLLGQPVLNYGVNGDQVRYGRGAPGMIRKLNGVTEVVFLMGINDLMTGSLKDLDAYRRAIAEVTGPLAKDGVRVYLGTLPPGTGYKRFDESPAHETLRQEINAWIRSGPENVAAVIDFDAALRDPDAPEKMRADYQADWLHPNDAGYQAMAACAEGVIRAARARAGGNP